MVPARPLKVAMGLDGETVAKSVNGPLWLET